MDDKVKVFNESGHGYWLEGFGCIRAGGGFNDANTGHVVIVLNDQGGAVMDVSYDKTATLRAQEHGHQPIACYALKGNFIDRETQQNGIGWREMVEYTLDATDRHGVCYEISAGEVRKGKAEVCQTLRSRMGTGGGNVPILIMDMTRRDRVDVKPPDKAPTMQCAMGAGGGNVPVVMIKDEAGEWNGSKGE